MKNTNQSRFNKTIDKMNGIKKFICLLLSGVMIISCERPKWKEINKEQYILITQRRGVSLGYSLDSGIEILYSRGYAFKDLNHNKIIDPYEDWRKSMVDRARDLASRLSIDEIAGLMLYSEHQAVPADAYGYWSSTYNGTSLEDSGLPHSAINDKQKKFLSEDNLRAVLLVRAESPGIAAEWNNNLQAFCEGRGHGIPVNISSDPRHEAEAFAEFNAGSGGKISLWPCQLGLAATFDPVLVKRFAEVASCEYRSLGIATALSPQADIGTEPRWFRFYGTFGENPILAADMTRAYIDGFQTSSGEKEISGGWGFGSVNTMVKHWPGGGSGEGGRDAHYAFGKYAVYPGKNFEAHLKPFIDGAFRLAGKTNAAAAVMPYYTISYGVDPSGENVGNSYSKYIIKELLRDKYGYDGVICTDWAVTHDETRIEDSTGKPWGREGLTVAERHYEILKAGVDQFGGNNNKEPVLDAYRMWVNDFGEKNARARFEQSAFRLLMNMFRTGLFDNPYVDPVEAEKIVGSPEFMREGYEAQLKSVVMLKNHALSLPQSGRKKVYFPGKEKNGKKVFPIDTSIVSRYYDIVDKPVEADFALVLIDEPKGGTGYDVGDRFYGGNGYVPISLQYEEYRAYFAREKSVAGGDPLENFTNRSYKGKSVLSNKEEMQLVRDVRDKMGAKPLIVVVSALRPLVLSEIEPYSDGLILTLGVQNQVVLDIVSGNFEPQGLLPMQMPSSMKVVEEQREDCYNDMQCYKDADGNTYDFAFGLNWDGVIYDKRVKRYKYK